MPKVNTNRIRIKGIKSKKIEADFSGGQITSVAGALLLRQAEGHIKFLRDVSRSICDTRHQSYVEHSIKTMLTQRVFGIACGYNR